MTAAAGTELRALREHPFELLRELERRSRVAITGSPADDVSTEEWVGIGLRLGNERFVVAREEVREVLMLPSTLTRVPGAKPWIRGLANVRGHLLPIADLRGFLGAGEAERATAARGCWWPTAWSFRSAWWWMRSTGSGGSSSGRRWPSFRRRRYAATGTCRAHSGAGWRSGRCSAWRSCCESRVPEGSRGLAGQRRRPRRITER